MSYNRENFISLKAEFEEKHLSALNSAKQRLEKLHTEIPELAEIDAALANTGLRLVHEFMQHGDDQQKRIEALRQENKALQNDRKNCLKYNGYPEDYTDIKYSCPDCEDLGYIGTKMCQCFRKALTIKGYESSGIGNLIKTQSFESFDIDYYKDNQKTYENIKNVYLRCKQYASEFNDKECSNLLLMGATGLGKTHLSTSIAKVLIERGFDVVYDTAQNILADFEYERFNRAYNSERGENDNSTNKYFTCDLLIIDDLGTEMSNQFTISCLYNIINTRINHKKSVIINTNLSRDELRKRYADRITSRLFGEFSPLLFIGHDIREKKLKK